MGEILEVCQMITCNFKVVPLNTMIPKRSSSTTILFVLTCFFNSGSSGYKIPELNLSPMMTVASTKILGTETIYQY